MDNEIRPEDSFPRGEKSTWDEQASLICNGQLPDVQQEIPALLCWLEDYNWPGAHKIANYLVSLGHCVVPHVKRVLRKTADSTWKYWLVVGIINQWPQEYIHQVGEELVSMATADDNDELHIVSLMPIISAELLPKKTIARLIDEKYHKYPQLRRDLDELRSQLEPAD